jgi:hypothetical protein
MMVKRGALVLLLALGCGDSETAPAVTATTDGVAVELCVAPADANLIRVQASASELAVPLIFRDNEDGLTFQDPWTGGVNAQPDGSRCYTLDNLDPIPSELSVGVFTDGPVGDFAFTVPVAAP